jgi:phosphotriesterase-related protein
VPHLNTARGAIDTTDLGVTLMHEHVFIMTTEILQNYPEAWGDESKRIADPIARLNELKSRGVDTIFDVTVIGLGRHIPRTALRDRGVTDAQLTTMLVDNPRRVFENQGAY